MKVGPRLTFALREALYALDAIADVIDGHPPTGRLMAAMEEVMQDAPENWSNYYSGSDRERWLQRHFSYSDRIRYYWPSEKAKLAVAKLLARFEGRTIPEPVLSQFLGDVTQQRMSAQPDQLLLSSVQQVLRVYEHAANPMQTSAAQ